MYYFFFFDPSRNIYSRAEFGLKKHTSEKKKLETIDLWL